MTLLSPRATTWGFVTTLLVVVRISFVFSLVPPHPDFVDWEPVHVMRQRLNITYNYQPQNIPAEHCRYATEEECRELDVNFGLRKASRRLNPSIGTRIRVLVLLMKFPETDYTLPNRSYFETLFNGNGVSDINPVGSIKEWFRYNSVGKYRVVFDVRDWEPASNSAAFYAQGNSGQNQNLIPMFSAALNKFDSSGSVDWLDGYVADNGMLNHLVVLHSGYGAEAGDKSCLPGSYKDRLWSGGIVSADPRLTWNSKDFWELSGFMIATALAPPRCNSITGALDPPQPVGMAVITHEYNHGLGSEDLYDQTGDPNILIGGVGRFDIMASAQGWDYNFTTPGHMSTYSRTQLGWVQPILIDRDGYYAIQPLEIANTVYKITHGYPAGEYLLIESKQKIKWDSDIDQGGLVIFHVDEKANEQKQRSYPGGPGWPGAHYRVAVAQADGLFEIERGINFGDKNDFWIKGMTLGATTNNVSTASYQSGTLVSTGVKIQVLSKPGLIMTFRVSGITARGAGLPQTGSVTVSDENNVSTDEGETTNRTGQTVKYILGMFAGLSLMLGLMMIILL